MWGASTSSRASPTACAQFQVVPPCGGHQAISRIYKRKVWFQVVPPCGGHLDTNDLPELQQKFQVVPPCGGHHHASLQRATAAGFKSCPRVGGIRASDCIWLPYKVSSRAPVWGASRPVSRRLDDGQFQVVPPCGGHHKYYMAISPLACFKSCPRVGGIRLLPLCGNLSGVSSRAPVWGASFALHIVERMAQGFKSCPRVGGIPSGRWMPNSVGGFKSCPRVGGIFAVECVFNTIVCFKSCPRVGGIRLRCWGGSHRSAVSSRAPVWGASKSPLISGGSLLVSSRAPVWGASR